MGEVHLARDTRLNRKVAIKLLRFGHDGRRVSQERFQAEAKAVSSLNHPRICALYDVGVQDGREYFVMEFVEGETIAQRLDRGPFPPDQILRHAIEIAEALDHAHRHGIVHRDLKPANVMLTKAGVKLLDFGVAKTLQPDALDTLPTATREQPLTDPGQVVGTLQYMSPEQLEGRAIDERTDLFAFGALIYEMATGRRAFNGNNRTSVVTAILGSEPPAISTLQPLAPPALDRVVKKCLAKDPDERWQTARDLTDALKWINQDTSSAGPPRSMPAVSAARTKRARGVMIGITATLVAAAVTGWIWRQSDDAFEVTNLRLIPAFSGEQWGGEFSPDGNMVAFLKPVNGIPQIWVKNLAEGDPLQITSGDVPVSRLAWSPLNDRIVYGRFRDGLWSVPPLGGPARRILEFGDAPKFSADGKRLAFTRGNSIWVANADGSDARMVDGVPQTPWPIDRFPDLSPDGTTLAFYHPASSPIAGDVWLIPAAGGQARQLTFDSSESGSPRWTPDGRFIVYSSARAGGLTLWRVPATGGAPEPLTSGAGEDTEPDISADGKSLLYSTQRKSWSLVMLDPATGDQREVITRRANIVGPQLSPNGDRIAFSQPEANGVHLHVVGPDGGNVRQVTYGEGEQDIFPEWSADGSSLFFYRNAPSASFRKISVEGGTSTEVAPLDFVRQRGASVDARGRSIVYTLIENGENKATVVRDLSTGKEHSVARALSTPRWSRDSQSVFGTYISPDPGGDAFNRWVLAACPVGGQPCRDLTRGFLPTLSNDGSRLFYLRDAGAARNMREVWTASIDGRGPRKLTTMGPLGPEWGYDVSPKDQVLFTRFNESRRELWVAQLK
jgi:eukaryotic-like serine/threonine-protein kinase